MTEPIAVDAAQFFDFIGGPGLKVVLVSVHPAHEFNRALCEQLAGEHETISFGTVGLTDLVIRGGPALPFLHRGLRECGAPWPFGVLPGYCLFRGTQMLAWDAGLPSFADVGGILRGTLLGVIWSGLTNDVSFVTHALRFATDHVAAQRVVLRFREAAAARRPRQAASPASGGAPPIDDLRWAYQMLGVSPAATDREVHRAWRRKRVEHHPDHAGSDRAEFERRSRISAEINRAREIIVANRSEYGRRTDASAA
jgi:DnaJ domain